MTSATKTVNACIETKEQNDANKLKEIGRSAYSSITDMVAALNCDYYRLEKLRDEYEKLTDEVADSECEESRRQNECELAEWVFNFNEEYQELKKQAGDCLDRDDAEQRIQDDALSVEVRSGWYVPGDEEGKSPSEFTILLTTGGPAVRIRGELNEYLEPSRAWLEVQDWFLPWSQYSDASQDVLLDYARCFYFGE